SYIKIIVDEKRFERFKSEENPNGMYYLTGSQIFETMAIASESLAGRVSIIDLFGLSTRELNSLDEAPFIPIISELQKKNTAKRETIQELFKRIFIGSFPELWLEKRINVENYFENYVRMYIERDIRKMINVKDELKFHRFLISIAARTAQEVNYDSISNDADISAPTAKAWLSILVNTKLVYLLTPFSTNKIKRLSKTPKIYFMDTGLACYLAGYKDHIVLEKSAYNGAIFETYVITEIIKSFTNNGLNPQRHLTFFRDKNKNEIDLLIEYNNVLYPVEIKKSSNPKRDAIKNFAALEKLDYLGEGSVVCMKNDIFPVDQNNYCIPIQYI
ncbi:MAG: ATP-binding protein, partial [Anaerovoracaceae bacterium]